MTQIFTPTIRSQELYFSVTLILNLILKFFELFKGLRLVFHQIDIPVSTQVIREGENITVASASLNTHWTAHIGMYDFQQVGCSLHCSGERSLGHLAQEAWFARVK